MQTIKDNELILFHYRDGVSLSRVAEIEAAMSSSEALRERYQRLCLLLGEVDMALAEPSANFERRLWARLDQRMANDPAPSSGKRPSWLMRLRELLAVASKPRLAWAGGLAAILMIALGIGFLAGRNSATPPIAAAHDNAPTMASRMLDSYVAGHLRATEGLLLTAVNDESGALLKGNQALAENLVESNRLYAVAAVRAGNTRLADFLRQLEPVLIELANQPSSATVENREGLRDFLRDTDLLFQVRATESRIDADSKRSL
ncbi:MAG: hypothetical protein ABI866_02635 [Dokdonella sp.]